MWPRWEVWAAYANVGGAALEGGGPDPHREGREVEQVSPGELQHLKVGGTRGCKEVRKRG